MSYGAGVHLSMLNLLRRYARVDERDDQPDHPRQGGPALTLNRASKCRPTAAGPTGGALTGCGPFLML